jgi:AcrR family transcriptional regulator
VNGHLDVLPRGRHHLTREQVQASQRARMLRGMVDAVAEKGYVRTTVADVLERARASRETFYEHFANKEECFLAAYEESVQLLTGRLRGALGAGEAPLVRFERVLDAYLEGMAAQPELAQIFLIEVYAAGPEARRRRAEVLQQFGDVFYELLGDAPELRSLPDPRFAARAAVAAISGLVTSMVAAGDHESLPALKQPILDLIGAVSAVDQTP